MFRNFFKGLSKSTDTQQLSQTTMLLVNTTNPTEIRYIIESHPELLSSEANELLKRILANENNKEVAQHIASLQELLYLCPKVGLDKAFQLTNRSNHLNRVIREIKYHMNNDQPQQCTELLQKEIQKISHKTHPLEWRNFHFHLGNSLFDTFGHFPEKNEEIIEAYQQFLKGPLPFTPRELPMQLHVLHRLATLYPLRVKGNRAENIEQSIAIYQELLNLISPENNLTLWFTVTKELAQRYSERVSENRKENLDQAIALYEKIMEKSPQDTMPSEFIQSVKISWKEALDELIGMQVFHSSKSIHKYSLMKFIFAESWADSRRILEETPELLTDEIDALLNQMIEHTLNENLAPPYKEHLALLRRCRLVGFDTAFYEKQGDAVDPALLDDIFLASIPKICLAIHEHPEFLTDATFQMLESITESLSKGDDTNIYYMRRARLDGIYSLLRRCRDIGTDEAVAERMLVEIPFPYPEDAPKELKDAQARIAKVMSKIPPEEQAKGLSK